MFAGVVPESASCQRLVPHDHGREKADIHSMEVRRLPLQEFDSFHI